MGKSQQLYQKAKILMPGGTQLLSKRPEMFLPNAWPAYYSRAKGCEIWDIDGKKYVDMSIMGVGSCILGYADSEVNKKVLSVIEDGAMSTLNAPEEVALAELLIRLHPWAHMVRYARTGGEAMAMAVRIARAYSKKDIVLFCGYHGWHDWYLSANLASSKALDGQLLPGLQPLGVPRKLKGTSFPFSYNDTEGFMKLIDRNKNRVGVIVVESVRNNYPKKEFVATLNRAAKEYNSVLVVDEITAGFRLNIGGAHLLFGLEPDIAVFAKGMSNGFPMAAVIGKRKVMEVAQDTFVSSTYWTERIGPAAALATIKKMARHNVPSCLHNTGKKIQEGWKSIADARGLDIEVGGIYPLSHFSFRGKDPLVLKTLFTQLMLQKGFLATDAFYASYAHTDNIIAGYLEATDAVFRFLVKAIKKGNARRYLKSSVCHTGFMRLA